MDATTKNMLFLLDAKDPKAHLTKIKQHFLLMAQHHDNLIKMELTIFDSHYNTTIMPSLPDSYLPTLQTIMATECASTILGMSSSNKIKPNDLIAFIIEEAQHHIFNDKRTKTAKSALGKKPNGRKQCHGKGKEKSGSDVMCENCKRTDHNKPNYWSKGRGKWGQGPRGQNSKKEEKKSETVTVADVNNDTVPVIAASQLQMAKPSK